MGCILQLLLSIMAICASEVVHPACDAAAALARNDQRVLLVDLFLPSIIARWRTAEFHAFVTELDTDIMVMKRAWNIDGTPNDYEWPEPVDSFRPQRYDLLIFNPKLNHLNRHNDADFDGTAFNGQQPIDYVLRLKKYRHQPWHVCQYAAAVHIFAIVYWEFSYLYPYYPSSRNIVHLHTGGGIFQPTPRMRGFEFNIKRPLFRCGVHIIHAEHFLAKALEHRTCNPQILVPGVPLLLKGEQIPPKPARGNRPITVAVANLGDPVHKGVPVFLRLADLYRQRFPHDDVVFMTIGNPGPHPGVVRHGPMPQSELDKLYRNEVDVFVNFEPNEFTRGPNGWPLGREAFSQGVVLVTTDRAYSNEGNGYNFNGSVHVLSNDTDVEAAMAIIKRYHDDRALMDADSRQAQADFQRAFSYDRVQGRILEYVRQVMDKAWALPIHAPRALSTSSAPAKTGQRPGLRALRVLSTDFHISPIADLKDVIYKQIKSFDVSVRDLSLSAHCWRTGTCAQPSQLKVLRQGGWEQGIYATSEYKKEFFHAYQSDPFVPSFDTVVCMHPTGMCEFYMPFNLSMIIWSTTRFEHGREGSSERIRAYVANFRAMAARPGAVVLANNWYDVRYVHYFTGIMPKYVPSLCTYPGVKYQWTLSLPSRRTEILVHGFRLKRNYGPRDLHTFLAPLHSAAREANLPYRFVGDREGLGDNYTYADLVTYPAILYLPYQVSVMSFYEQYRMGIPILAPSLDLLATWHVDHLMVSDRTWYTAMHNQPQRASLVARHPDADEPFDPNDEFSYDAIRYWLQFSDYYQFPHIIRFDNWDDIVAKLQTVDLEDVSRKMLAFSAQQEAEVVKTWEGILASMPRAEDRPPLSGSYEQRMDAIYGRGKWVDY